MFRVEAVGTYTPQNIFYSSSMQACCMFHVQIHTLFLCTTRLQRQFPVKWTQPFKQNKLKIIKKYFCLFEHWFLSLFQRCFTSTFELVEFLAQNEVIIFS